MLLNLAAIHWAADRGEWRLTRCSVGSDALGRGVRTRTASAQHGRGDEALLLPLAFIVCNAGRVVTQTRSARGARAYRALPARGNSFPTIVERIASATLASSLPYASQS